MRNSSAAAGRIYTLEYFINACLKVTYNMPLIDDGFEALLEPFYNGKKLTDPVSTKEDKFQLLPAFLKVKGMPSRNP